MGQGQRRWRKLERIEIEESQQRNGKKGASATMTYHMAERGKSGREKRWKTKYVRFSGDKQHVDIFERHLMTLITT